MEQRSNTEKMAAYMRLIKREINGAVSESMERRGIHYPCNWGVSLHVVRRAAATFAPDHPFARFLCGQQLRELRLASYVIADPEAVTADELDFWGASVTNVELAENLAFSLLSRTRLAGPLLGRVGPPPTPQAVRPSPLRAVGRRKRPPPPGRGGGLGVGAAGVLAHVDRGEERAKVQAEGGAPRGGGGGEPPIEDGGAECQSPLHGTASFLDLVKYSLRT